MLDDLQINEAGGEQQEGEQNGTGSESHAKAEAIVFAILCGFELECETATQDGAFQMGRLASCSIGRYCGNSSTNVSGSHKAAPMKGPAK